MSAVIIESTSVNAMTSGVIPAPSGIQVGDTLLCIVMDDQSDFASIVLPAGWVTIQSGLNSSTDYLEYRIGYKVAVLADTTATDYTFTNCEGGVIYRLSNCAPTAIGVGTGVPDSPDTLLIVVGMSADNDFDWASFSGYSVTGAGSPTITERYDIRQYTGFSCSMGVGDGFGTTQAEITAFDVTITANTDTVEDTTKLLIQVPSIVDATGTNALLAVSPTMFAPTASAGTTGTNTLHAVSPTMFAQSGNGQRGTPWTNPSKPATNWNNLPK
jgi:hypothetical protein